MAASTGSGRISRLLQAASGLLSSHISLFGLELQDEVERLVALLLLAAAGAVFASMFLILATLLALLLFWEQHRIAVAGTLAALYGALALGCLIALRQRLVNAPTPFALTTEELARDRAMLAGRPAAEESP